MTEQETKQRFDELLPWYVNDTLGEDDRMWFEQYLHAHPQVASELAWHQSLKARIQENAPAVSATVGLNKLLARIHDEQMASRPSFAERLASLFGGFRLTPALATAFGVIALQAGVIALLFQSNQDLRVDNEYATVRSIKPPFVLEGPLLKVNFKPDAKESEMRLLLVTTGGVLVAGPTQLGDYFVKVPAEKIDQAASELKASTIVEAVATVTTLPEKD
jgi:hypothetical protein